jgi:hypothetical protein
LLFNSRKAKTHPSRTPLLIQFSMKALTFDLTRLAAFGARPRLKRRLSLGD